MVLAQMPQAGQQWPGPAGPPGVACKGAPCLSTTGRSRSSLLKQGFWPQVVLGILSAPFPGDGNNTLLHYVCCGTPLGSVGRLLWVSSGGAPEVSLGAACRTALCFPLPFCCIK
jgi:hypothetical protein